MFIEETFTAALLVLTYVQRYMYHKKSTVSINKKSDKMAESIREYIEDCVLSLSFDEIKEIEGEIMQLAYVKSH